MQTFNYEVILSIKDVNIIHRIEDWFPALANIYGQPSKHFDGYVSMVIKDNTTITIICYLVEDNEEKDKLDSLKSRNKDWPGFRSLCIMDAIKIHAKTLGYQVTETSIELLQTRPKDRSVTPM